MAFDWAGYGMCAGTRQERAGKREAAEWKGMHGKVAQSIRAHHI